MNALGKHILAEYKSCDVSILNDIQKIENLLLKAAGEAGAFVMGSSFHRFEPHGVSGVVIISESHLAIHTWPELGYAAVDIFTCGDEVTPEASFEFLERSLKSQDASFKTIIRGEQT
jgi:S-adenosylmethionine decarboxylase